MPAPTFTSLPPELLKLVSIDEALLFDPARAVYTNRDLDLGQIKLVGFDMDYTLAIYNKAPMEQLQYDLTVDSLVKRHGYPEEIRALQYDPSFVVRGLIVDKRTGHLVKMDTHGRVGRVFHGRRRLGPEEVESAYAHAKLRLGSNTIASADTLFSMPEVCLYANLIDFFEARHAAGVTTAPLTIPRDAGGLDRRTLRPDPANDAGPKGQDPRAPGADLHTGLLGNINTWKLFDDVRNAIDDIHRDGTLKDIIMGDLARYFVVDSELPLTLHKLRSAGKRLFLLTNSYWLYTNAVMSFFLDGKLKEYSTWKQYFDIVIVGGKKPRFFTEREPFLEVAQQDNVEEVLGEMSGDRFERGRVYQGGNIEAFERVAQAQGGEILYVGDHIFGDIVRSKKDSRWRTCLIVEELEHEIRGTLAAAETIQSLDDVDDQRHALDEEIGKQRALLTQIEIAIVEHDERGIDPDTLRHLEDAAKKLKKEVDVAKRALRALDKQSQDHQDALDKQFNPWWGRLLKASNELSRFGAQVELYACTYTSRVSNFLQYSPVHFFRAPRERMSHDVTLARGDKKRAAVGR